MLIILMINDDEDGAGDDDKQSSLDRHVQKPDIAKKEGGLHLGADPWNDQLAILTNLIMSGFWAHQHTSYLPIMR